MDRSPKRRPIAGFQIFVPCKKAVVGRCEHLKYLRIAEPASDSLDRLIHHPREGLSLDPVPRTETWHRNVGQERGVILVRVPPPLRQQREAFK